MALKRLPVKKATKKAVKPSSAKKPTLPKKALPAAKKAVKKTTPKKGGYVKTNKPPAVKDAEIKLAMQGNWKEAAKAHQKRTGILYRRSLVAVAVVYRKHLRAVLAAIKAEESAGR